LAASCLLFYEIDKKKEKEIEEVLKSRRLKPETVSMKNVLNDKTRV
jgi:hypothetical protein